MRIRWRLLLPVIGLVLFSGVSYDSLRVNREAKLSAMERVSEAQEHGGVAHFRPSIPITEGAASLVLAKGGKSDIQHHHGFGSVFLNSLLKPKAPRTGLW